VVTAGCDGRRPQPSSHSSPLSSPDSANGPRAHELAQPVGDDLERPLLRLPQLLHNALGTGESLLHHKPDAPGRGALGQRSVRLRGQRIDRRVDAGGLAGGGGEVDGFRPLACNKALDEQALPGKGSKCDKARKKSGNEGSELIWHPS